LVTLHLYTIVYEASFSFYVREVAVGVDGRVPFPLSFLDAMPFSLGLRGTRYLFVLFFVPLALLSAGCDSSDDEEGDFFGVRFERTIVVDEEVSGTLEPGDSRISDFDEVFIDGEVDPDEDSFVDVYRLNINRETFYRIDPIDRDSEGGFTPALVFELDGSDIGTGSLGSLPTGSYAVVVVGNPQQLSTDYTFEVSID
jgi:hypothetical protein